MDLQEQLKHDGFFKVENLIAPSIIKQLLSSSKHIINQCTDEHRESVKSNGTMCNLAKLPEFVDIITYRPILDLLERIGGKDIRWTGGYLISKPAGGPPLFWHQDWWGWDDPVSYQSEAVQLFVMIYLTETSPDKGCLRVIPGSHRKVHALHKLGQAHSENLIRVENPLDPAFASHPDEIAVTAKPGDVIIGDSRVIHGAYANEKGGERPLLTLWYSPNFRDLPKPIMAHYENALRTEADDIKDGTNATEMPYEWPDNDKEKILSVLPQYSGTVRPQKWNRLPDLDKLIQ